MSSRTYSGVTLSAAQELLNLAKQYNGTVDGDTHTGTISAYGCKVLYSYDAAHQELQLSVLQRPFIVSPDTVLNQIESRTGLKHQ